MARDWETWLRNSIGPASPTEEADRDRTEQRIREAILADSRLAGNVRVFVKGSYANSTNVSRDSDVDIAVEWKAWSYITRTNEATDLSWEELGVRTIDPGPSPSEYRSWVEQALTAAFGSGNVDTSGNKAIRVDRGPTTLDADVVPCFRHHRYHKPGRPPYQGIQLRPKNGGVVQNWPQQNYDNGVSKNSATSQRYKQIIRAVKRLENDMVKNGILSSEVHGYFIECLLYNLPNRAFTSDLTSYKNTVLKVLATLWKEIEDGRYEDWVEVNGLKWLWRGGQTWTAAEASDFSYRAWNYLKGNT